MLDSKNKVGRPKKPPTITPSLRVDKAKWGQLKAKHPNKVNKLFNEWVDYMLGITNPSK